jgi:hypothetical protein
MRGIGAGVLVVGVLASLHIVTAANLTSQVIVGNASPSVSAVSVNGGSAITLTANTTTNIVVNATVTDNNGCNDLLLASSAILLYRSGVTSSSCNTAQSSLNCYKLTAFTATSSCQSSVTVNTTSTFTLQYFADATDASSSYAAQTWQATVIAYDGSAATGTADSSGVELNTLTAINVPTASLNYGTLSPSTNTGGTNQNATTTNAGNSSTTLQLSSLATLTSGANSISTSSQHYASSTFTYGGGEQALSGTAATVSGFTLTSPTSTTNVARSTFWGIAIPAATPTGTYSGTNVFSALFVP